MQLYVPEIGDHIQLTKDWNFKLHAESRNETLGKFLNHYIFYNSGSNWVNEEVVPPFREIDYHVNYKSREEFIKFFGGFNYDAKEKADREAEQNCPEFVKYWADNKIWREEALRISIPELDVTIPSGTVLSIDRIYIRKGASDFSSITFYAKNLGSITSTNRWSKKTSKKKALRFWAKLSDCNNIEFIKVDKN